MLFFLLIPFFLCQTTVTFPNSCWTGCPSDMPANIEYVGRGYDIFFGSPITNKIDTGFRSQIYDANDISGPQPNPTLSIPRGMEGFDTLACQTSFTSKSVTSSSSYQTEMNDHVDFDVSASGGYMGIEASASFSYSQDSQKTASGMSNSFFKYTYSTAFCEIYRAGLLKFEVPLLSTGFSQAIAALPANIETAAEKEIYIDFIKEFGTHIVKEIAFGSRLTFKKTFTSSAWSTAQSSFSSMEMAASVSVSVDMFGATGGVDAGFGMSSSQSSSIAQEMSNTASSTEMFSLGARPPADGNTATWAAEAALSPVPITYKLSQLNDWYWYDSTGVKVWLIPEPARSNIPTAVSLYYADIQALYTVTGVSYASCDGIPYNDGLTSYCVKWDATAKRSWLNARDVCIAWGGDLVTIRDDAKNNFIANTFTASPIWLGLNKLDKAQPTTFFWGQKSPISYTNWYTGYPVSEAAQPASDCVFMNNPNTKTGTWLNYQCDVLNYAYAVCERPYAPPAIPASTTPPSCTDGNEHSGLCIKVVETGLTWYDARKDCMNWHPEWNSDLVSMGDTSDIHDYIETLMPSYSGIINFYWIGLTDLEVEGTFRYVDGSYLGIYAPISGSANTVGLNCFVAYTNANLLKGWWVLSDCSMSYLPYVCSHKMALDDDDDLYEYVDDDDYDYDYDYDEDGY